MVKRREEKNLIEKKWGKEGKNDTIIKLYLKKNIKKIPIPLGQTTREEGSFSVEFYLPKKKNISYFIKTLYNMPCLDTVSIATRALIYHQADESYLNRLSKVFPKFDFGEEIKKRVCSEYEMMKNEAELSRQA